VSTHEAISQGDAATRLGISRATVERWVNQGRLNTVRTGERGGARRVLVDDAFQDAKNASQKIPHARSKSSRKSLTPKNPSPAPPAQIPHAHTALPTALATESLTDHAEKTRDIAQPVAESSESLAGDPQESLITEAEKESLTGVDAPDTHDTPVASLGRQRLRHPLDADLVPLTGSRDSEPWIEYPAAPATPARPLRTRAAIAFLLVAVAAAAALAIYQPWHQAPGADAPASSHTAKARGAQARTVGAGLGNPVVPRVPRPRGGPARPTSSPTTTAPAKSHAPTTPAQSPAPVTQPTSSPTTRPHRQHPITPCQSTGICVPN
jgi:excisionase family DNA binding protein